MFAFFKAKIWSGAGWLLTLCVILVIVGVSYLWAHSCYKGTDHKKLDSNQLLNIDNVLAVYPDPDSVFNPLLKDKVKLKVAIVKTRGERDKALFNFLTSEFGCQIDECCLKEMDGLLVDLNNKDVKTYLNTKEVIVKDFFWFVGPGSYVEVLYWSLIGVLVSLIYYVSLANRQQLKQIGDDDTGILDTAGVGAFDSSEISGQVSKLFYAPVCALVLVLGYDMLSSSGNKMTDISMGKGLILFSFISGFFSGRVIKFIDQLKELVLPLGSKDKPTTGTPTADNPPADQKNADITVELQLAAALSAQGADVIDGGFNSAIVTLKPQTGDAITLTKPVDDQGAIFNAAKVPFGKYNLQATMASKSGDTIINLAASKDIEVNDANKSFELELDKTSDAG
ncbi:hypothetical protein [Mucilaginibacter sp. SP1R1]|uniref:hypothetical protein n=1 Tax=Mucilaginibacter sp. SP1R1 TaxID=2723091 RepID=UPI001612C29B|nr:hypothetical protein [Mucilaginibacter sp. SP1R1]MBB6151380.1 hypothetical protein [Mucilaginibacter sp. SP1R1]